MIKLTWGESSISITFIEQLNEAFRGFLSGLARRTLFTDCAPSLQAGFKLEQVCGNSRIHKGTSEDETSISKRRIER
jgi:hypothetical protein